MSLGIGLVQVSDRILACNGDDFTAESNRRVEERFREMADKEPLLRIAVTRDLTTDLHQSPEVDQESALDRESERPMDKPRPDTDCEKKLLTHCIHTCVLSQSCWFDEEQCILASEV